MNRRVAKAASLAFVAAVIVVWAVTLRPQALGGPAIFVAVRGSSMLPTYEHGDLVVVQSAAGYKVGEVVAYRVPAGEVGEGRVVIHRIVAGDATSGFTLQGDNNSAPDPWHPRQAEMVGVAVQNALVTQFTTSVLALAIPGAAPALLTGAAATTRLLSSPGVENSVWVVSDGVADSADWIVVAALAPLAALSATIGGRWRPSTHGRLLIGDGRRRVARARC